MNRKQMQRLTAEETKKGFRGHKIRYCKYVQRRPESSEREYIRTVNAYMRILKEEVERSFPELKEAYKANKGDVFEGGLTATRADSITDFTMVLEKIFKDIRERLTSRTNGFGMRRRLENLAHLTRKLTVKEWKNAISATLGINILEDYYMGGEYDELLREWIEKNIGLIVTMPQDTLERMHDIVYDSYLEGRPIKDLTKSLQKEYGLTKGHARLIARDQTAKLNGQIQQKQQRDAGVEEYTWSTSGDERVRESHRELNGKRFRWDDPPTNSDGRTCHPGEDYQCRCVALPVFEWDKLTLPVAGSVDEATKTGVSA